MPPTHISSLQTRPPAGRRGHLHARSWNILVVIAVAWLLLSCGSGSAAEPRKIPPPEDVNLHTKDGIDLQATFYPGSAGKESVPVILLHVWKGNRGDYVGLAKHLQSLGHAVIVPDLRGHGGSRGRNQGLDLDAAVMRPADFEPMVTSDLEAVKHFLLEKNNLGELNIDKLCVVGAEMGAVIALRWAALDWSWEPLATGKQGQDVKALVLISPEWQFKSMRIMDALVNEAVQKNMSILVIVGKGSKGNSKAMADAKRIVTGFERFHPQPSSEDQKELFFDVFNTSLQGTKLLAEPTFHVNEHIARFIELRLVKRFIPWSERKMPLD